MEIREILIHEFIKSKKSIKKLYSADMVMTKWRKLNGRIPSFINISGPKLNYDNLLTSEITLKAKSEKLLRDYKINLFHLLITQKQDEIYFYAFVSQYEYFKIKVWQN